MTLLVPGADSQNRIAGALTGINTSAADDDSGSRAIAIGTRCENKS